MNWRNVTLFSHYSQYCQCLITFLSSFGNNLWQDILHLFRMDQHYAWEYFLCIPVFPTDPGWQPVRISSWWWCICWSETPSPAPASDGLCTPPCISPSFLFYLRTRQMHTVRTRRLHLFIYSFVCFYLNDRESADSRLGRLACLDRPGLSERRIVIQPRVKSTSSPQIRKLSCVWSSSDDKANFKEPGLGFPLVIEHRLKLGTNMWKWTVKQLNLFDLFVFKLSCKREIK